MVFDLIDSLFNQIKYGRFFGFRLLSQPAKSIQRDANIVGGRDTLNGVHSFAPLVKKHQSHVLHFMSPGKATPCVCGDVGCFKLYIGFKIAFYAVEVVIESSTELAAWVVNLHHGWRAVANHAQVILYLLVVVISRHRNAHHSQYGCSE